MAPGMSWIDHAPELRNELSEALTERQLHIYILRSAGCSWDTIATMKGLSVRTVRAHYRRATQVRDLLDMKEAA